MPKLPSAPDNPCADEQKKSYQCLSKNNYDRDACEWYFANYTNCMKFWTDIKQDRRRKGISPEMPALSERERIKADYMATKPKT